MSTLVREGSSLRQTLAAVWTSQVVIKVGDEALTQIELAALIVPVGLRRLGHCIGAGKILVLEASSKEDLYRCFASHLKDGVD